MLSIPIELMMTPENALDDPVVGHIFIKYKTLLQGINFKIQYQNL